VRRPLLAREAFAAADPQLQRLDTGCQGQAQVGHDVAHSPILRRGLDPGDPDEAIPYSQALWRVWTSLRIVHINRPLACDPRQEASAIQHPTSDFLAIQRINLNVELDGTKDL
jgi:hypothetical protein